MAEIRVELLGGFRVAPGRARVKRGVELAISPDLSIPRQEDQYEHSTGRHGA